MTEGIWFNDDNPRRITLRSAACLVGKAPTKQKRIKAMFTMQLDTGGEDQISGLPEWLENARDYVMRNGETITAQHVVKECNVTMGDANLFKKTPTEAPRSQLDHFVIKQMGNSENPDTVLTFEMRTQFSTDLWAWCGQQSGEEFEVAFQLAKSDVAPLGGSPLALSPSEPLIEVAEGPEEDDASEGEEYDYEAERAEAISPKHDAEWEPEAPKKRGRKPKVNSAVILSEHEAVASAKKNLSLM